MNEVKKLYDDRGCVIKQFNNYYKSFCSAKTLDTTEQKQSYRNLCYNFEYKFGSSVPHCAKKGVCDEDCEYMRNFKE